MALIPYNKAHASALQRVAHLRARGLIIKRPKIAARRIDAIGYERLRIYFLSRRQLNQPGRPFLPGTSYNDIIRLYECDMKLRNACFAAVGQFELLLRNTLSEVLSDAFGSHPYSALAAFKDITSKQDAIKTFTSVYKKSKDQRAKHYLQTYSSPKLPPIWTMKEFLTFGAVSRIYQFLDGASRTKIANQFGVPSDHVFTKWLDCLVDLRNMCAHHDRLFNRSFQKQPVTLTRANIPFAPSNKLKAVLQCLDYVLDQRRASENITAKAGRIIQSYPEVRPAEAGY